MNNITEEKFNHYLKAGKDIEEQVIKDNPGASRDELIKLVMDKSMAFILEEKRVAGIEKKMKDLAEKADAEVKEYELDAEYDEDLEYASYDKDETYGEMMERLGLDGNAWAQEFIKVIKNDIDVDLDTMRSWFANVIENTKDVLYKDMSKEILDAYNRGISYGQANPKEGTFMWAVKQMKQGKKVRLPGKAPGWYCYSNPQGNRLLSDFHTSSGSCELSVIEFQATGWEILKENVFGDFSVSDEGDVWDDELEEILFNRNDIKDLRKAMDYAEELKCL